VAQICKPTCSVSWVAFALQFAIFFDAYVPLLGLALHSLGERLIGMREQRNEALQKEGAGVTLHPAQSDDAIRHQGG
jgi:hypothetical protein